MANRIVWLPPAAHDLEDIWTYIAANSPAYADGMTHRILVAVGGLADFPRRGPRVTDVRFKGIQLRELHVPPYRVIYRICGEVAVVLAIVHGARRLRKVLEGRPMG